MRINKTTLLPLPFLICLLAPAWGASESQTQTAKVQQSERPSTVDCSQQTWPAINAECLRGPSNTPVQNVRIVGQ
jgi:hypothetical protein